MSPCKIIGTLFTQNRGHFLVELNDEGRVQVVHHPAGRGGFHMMVVNPDEARNLGLMLLKGAEEESHV